MADLSKEACMLSNEFQVLLERYENDPALCSKLLRTHSLADPATFLTYAQTAIRERPVTKALKFVAGLALAAGLIEVLVDLYLRSRFEALALAHKLVNCDSQFDTILLEFLQRPHADAVTEENAINVVLDLLDEVSHGDRLVPSALKLLKHSNPKIRSKAALLIGRRKQNLSWFTNLSEEYDARVRANVLESLHGLKSDFVQRLFQDNVADANNRVAGNAVMGLYLLGHSTSIPLINEMAVRSEANFRNTSAWIMGQTANPRFVETLTRLIQDPEELVRRQAFRALVLVKKAQRSMMEQPQLHVSLGAPQIASDQQTVSATLHDESGQPVRGLPATKLLLKADSKSVNEYSLEEYECRTSLSIGFAVCLQSENDTETEEQLRKAIDSCSVLRRPTDRWAIAKNVPAMQDLPSAEQTARSKTSPGASPADDMAIEYSADQNQIHSMLEYTPTAGATRKSTLAIRELLQSPTALGKRHLIFLAAGPVDEIVTTLLAKRQYVSATIHVVALSPTWSTTELQQLAEAARGFYRPVESISAMQKACFEIYSFILHHYLISWKGSAAKLELDVYSEAGRGSALYEMAPATEPAAVPELVNA
jgi:HEAT repeats